MDKDEIRAQTSGRSRIDPGIGFLVVSGLFVWMSGRLPGTAAAYIALPDEVDVTPLFQRLPGWNWVLPRLESGDHVTFRDRDVPRETHSSGLKQPVERGHITPVHEIDVFLIPGLTFDATGGRVGRSRGLYDRMLADRRTDSVAIGVTLDARVVGAISVLEHDEKVDMLATETSVRECSPTN